MRIVELEQTGTRVDEDEIARLTEQYGLDKTLVERYALWAWNIISRGHLGRSFQWEQPVTQVIGERIALTMSISLLTLIFIWVVAIPIGNPVRIAINPLISTIGWLLPFCSNRVPAVPDELSSSFEPTVHISPIRSATKISTVVQRCGHSSRVRCHRPAQTVHCARQEPVAHHLRKALQ